MRHILFFVLMSLSAVVLAAELVVPERSLLLEYEASLATQQAQSFPFTISSSEQQDVLMARVLMKLPVSYSEFRVALSRPRLWCEFLILHLNIKSCVSERQDGDDVLVLFAGRKHYQPPEITYRLEYRFRLMDNREDYFEVLMDALHGPLSTSNYRIHLRAIPYKKQTVMALGLKYEQSFISRAATYSYLKTLGRDKVGFSLQGGSDGNSPEYVDGVKGVIERNVMRYFLALDSYLGSRDETGPDTFKQLLIRWYLSTERYHRQLYEYEQDTYMEAKQREYLNQQNLQLDIDKKAAEYRKIAG